MGPDLGQAQHRVNRLSPAGWQARYLQQAAWTRPLRDFLFPQIQINPQARILDVGCGPATLTGEISQRTGAGVFGLDRDPAAISLAKKTDPQVAFLVGDGLRLPFPRGVFDLTGCHFFLMWVRDPLAALAEMARVTRPGGLVMALAEPDYGGRIDYPPALEELGRLQSEALAVQGADPRLGRKLAGLFQRAGLRRVRTGILGGQWENHPANGGRDLEWEVIESDLAGRVPPEVLQDLRAAEAAAREGGEWVLFVPTFYAWGIV